MHSTSLAILIALSSAFAAPAPQEGEGATCSDVALAYRDWFYEDCADLMDVVGILDPDFADTLATTCTSTCFTEHQAQYDAVVAACTGEDETMNKVNMLALVHQFACTQEGDDYCTTVIAAKVAVVPEQPDEPVSEDVESVVAEPEVIEIESDGGEADGAQLFKRDEVSADDVCTPCVSHLQTLVSAFTAPVEVDGSPGVIDGEEGATEPAEPEPAPDSEMMALKKRQDEENAADDGEPVDDEEPADDGEPVDDEEPADDGEPVVGGGPDADDEILVEDESVFSSVYYNEDHLMWAGINPENLPPVVESMQDLLTFCMINSMPDVPVMMEDGGVENTAASDDSEDAAEAGEGDETAEDDKTAEDDETEEEDESETTEDDEDATPTDDAEQNTETKKSAAGSIVVPGVSLIALLASVFAF